MYYEVLSNILAERKRQLGMSEAYIAREAGLSQPTVHRILSGEHSSTSLNDIMMIAEVMGLKTETFQLEFEDVTDMLTQQAESLAKKYTDINNATNQMEGQGLTNADKKRLGFGLKAALLGGVRRNLWE